MARDSRQIQFVTPLPPMPTGIAQYSRDLLDAVDGHWRLTVIGEEGSALRDWSTIEVVTAGGRAAIDPARPVIYQLGNSGYHHIAYDNALSTRGVLVLHDVVLHHGRAGEFLRAGSGAGYKKAMCRRYGQAGAAVAEAVLAGQNPDDIGDYPLSEDYVERARLTAVHSAYAAAMLSRHVPDSEVVVIPMGVPLPALVEQQEARAALGIPQTAFVVASITHVNPFKRLHVVIRAFRRLIERVPEAMLVIAGSSSPQVNLERQIRMFGLQRHVRLMGYVSDDHARLLARAADVCVNLRYPSAGETSASLLRLLGAGRPALVTEDPSTSEYPRDAVVPIPVDRFEDEMITEALALLAEDEELRLSAGDAARRFVERQHSMSNAVAGYRRLIQRAFGIDLPALLNLDVREAPPAVEPPAELPAVASTVVDEHVADALHTLRLHRHDGTIASVARASVELGLDRLPLRETR